MVKSRIGFLAALDHFGQHLDWGMPPHITALMGWHVHPVIVEHVLRVWCTSQLWGQGGAGPPHVRLSILAANHLLILVFPRPASRLRVALLCDLVALPVDPRLLRASGGSSM